MAIELTPAPKLIAFFKRPPFLAVYLPSNLYITRGPLTYTHQPFALRNSSIEIYPLVRKSNQRVLNNSPRCPLLFLFL